MLVSIRGAVLGGTRLDWARSPVIGPMLVRKKMFPFVRARNVIYADLGRIVTWQKSWDDNITWRQEDKDQE